MEGSKPGTHHLGQSSTRQGFPGGPGGKEAASQCRSCKGHGVDPWVGKIPWRRTRQPTPVFLPGASHGQKSLAGYSPRGCKESDSMRARQSKLGVSLVFRQVGSLRSGSRESIMTSSRLNAAAGGRYLPFTSEAAEAPCLVDDLRLPRLQTRAVQGPFLLLVTAQYCLHVSCVARIFWCEPLLGVGAEAPRSGW